MIIAGEDFAVKYKESLSILKALRAVDAIYAQCLTIEQWKNAFTAMKVKPANTPWSKYFVIKADVPADILDINSDVEEE